MATLFEEYRFIERSESEINGAWKGAHLLLFFLAFVFGSFCTFCFHMLMYMFDEKCVLFPKLLSITSMRHNVIYEFIPSISSDKDMDDLPVDFVSTQWVEKSTCALPTYVPLVSGIFGLVWTTMFFMCSTGSRAHTSLQRPWRVLPPVFIFSLAMGILCCYTSAITHSGLQELCYKLGELTGSTTCTYTVNVATLAYEKRIRGVYQATRLTIVTAWLHTFCWLLSAALTLLRVLLAVDFQLVRINVKMHGDIDRMLERQEVHIRTVSPEGWLHEPVIKTRQEAPLVSNLLYVSNRQLSTSYLSLVPDERRKLDKKKALRNVSKDKRFIVKMLYDFMETLNLPDTEEPSLNGMNEIYIDESSMGTMDQFRQTSEIAPVKREDEEIISYDLHRTGEILEEEVHDMLMEIFNSEIEKLPTDLDTLIEDTPSYNTAKDVPATTKATQPDRSVMNISPEFKDILISKHDYQTKKARRKSNLKTIGVQTEKKETDKLRVRLPSEKEIFIHDSDESSTETEKNNKVDKQTQARDKEKQD